MWKLLTRLLYLLPIPVELLTVYADPSKWLYLAIVVAGCIYCEYLFRSCDQLDRKIEELQMQRLDLEREVERRKSETI